MLKKLVHFIQQYDGINDKKKLASLVQEEFSCRKTRSVYYTDFFAVRFSQSTTKNMGNTVLSLSSLLKYDNVPVIVCIITPNENHLLLINTSFLSKISHSSHELRVDNIKGSFNGSDILREINGIENIPENFVSLFSLHQNQTFEENLIRLVEATNNIVATGKQFQATSRDLENIYLAPSRTATFLQSKDYNRLKEELDEKVLLVEEEILLAAQIEDVKTRGNIIEFLITSEDTTMKHEIIDGLRNQTPFPKPYLYDGLGDYNRTFPPFNIGTDIKTKIMTLGSAPKGYNLDKMLQFLSENDSVFLLYFVGINCETSKIYTKLTSIFQTSLLQSTIIQNHWAGRNSRGVSQFQGNIIKDIILNEENTIDLHHSREFLEKIVST